MKQSPIKAARDYFLELIMKLCRLLIFPLISFVAILLSGCPGDSETLAIDVGNETHCIDSNQKNIDIALFDSQGKVSGNRGTLNATKSTGTKSIDSLTTLGCLGGNVLTDKAVFLGLVRSDGEIAFDSGCRYKFGIHKCGDGSKTMVNVSDVTAEGALPVDGTSWGTSNMIGSSPNEQDGTKAFDNNTSTKYLNWDASSNVMYFDVGSSQTFSFIGFATGDDRPERDPVSFTLRGGNINFYDRSVEIVRSGVIVPPSGSPTPRKTEYPTKFTLPLMGPFRYYWITIIPNMNASPAPNAVQVSEIKFYH